MSRCVLVLLLAALATGAQSGQVNWLTNADGNWKDAINWSSYPFLPGRGDDVTISRPGLLAITYSDTSSVVNRLQSWEKVIMQNGTLVVTGPSWVSGGLEMWNGILDCEGSFSSQGPSKWTGGTIAGWSGFTNSSSLTVDQGASKYLDATVFSNAGTVTHKSNIELRNGSVVNNLPAALYDMSYSTPFTAQTPTNCAINNFGTFRASTSGTIGYVPFNNYGGTVDVRATSLTLNGGGTWTGGSIALGKLSSLILWGPLAFTGSVNASGGGGVLLYNSTVQVDPGANLSFNLSGQGLTLGTSGTTTITLNGAITTSGDAIWGGCTLRGSGQFSNSGTLSAASGTKALDGVTLNNWGTFLQSTYSITLANGATINNRPGGFYEMKATNPFATSFPTDGQFNNYGTLSKPDTSSSDIRVPFNNLGGMVDVRAGNLTLSGGGSSTGGTFAVASGAMLGFDSDCVFSGITNASGDGMLGIWKGNFTVNPGAQFNAGMSAGSHSPGFGLFGGTVFANGVINNTGFGSWWGGTLKGHGGLVNTGVFDLSGGIYRYLDGGLLTNSGTITQSSSDLTIMHAGTLNNTSDGLYDLMGARIIASQPPDGSVITNSGIFRHSQSNGMVDLVPFNNQGGTIDVKSGMLSLTGGGTSSGGSISTAIGSVLELGGSHNWAGQLHSTGQGVVRLAPGSVLTASPGANLRFNQEMPPGQFQIYGDLVANGSITNEGAGAWYSGSIKGHGGFNNAGQLDIYSGVIDGGVLNNSGLVSQHVDLALVNGGVVNNSAGGSYDISGRITGAAPGAGRVNNYGLFSAGSGSGMVDAPFNNYGGTVRVAALNLSLNGGGLWSGGAVNLENGGVLSFNGSHNLAGTVDVSTPFGGGFIDVAGGALETQPNSQLNVNLTGQGIRANAGKIGGLGTISITGNYWQSEPATLLTNLTDLTTYGRISVSGQAYLDGTLEVALLGGYTPQLGDRFDVLTYGNRSGYFRHLVAPPLPGNLEFQIEYSGTGAALVVAEKLPSTEIPSVVAAKSEELGTRVKLSGIVSALFEDCFYVEDANRVAGIRVQAPLPPNPRPTPPAVGNNVTVEGVIALVAGNLTLTDSSWTVNANPGPLAPWFMGCGGLGGAAVGLQPGVKDAEGPTNVGLLAKIAGKATYVDPGGAFFYLDDGYKLNDGNTLGEGGTAVLGVRVVLPSGVSAPTVATFVQVTGVSVAVEIEGAFVRALRARSSGDIAQ